MISKEEQLNIYVISGPSGVGKDTLMDLIFEKYNQDLHIAITATTRQPRTNEINGINHYFKSEIEFKDLINEKLLIEWAKVYDNYYGVPYSEIIDNLKIQKKVLLRVDVQGAKRLKKIIPKSNFIFISPESENDLRLRLEKRHENSAVEIEKRIIESKKEVKEADWFDYIVINYPDKIEKAVDELTLLLGLKK
ncbi:MAG: guanylate kinase [Chloroflexota bacterium]|nr:guanylate kinase [Chloroflexota bacterium]